MALGSNEEIVRQATFEKSNIIKYHWCGLALLGVFIVTLPVVILVAIVYAIILGKVIDNWECVLTTRNLHVKKGILNTTEKTVPLEKITDLQMRQGWVMRFFGLHSISVETAGQSGPGSLIRLLGITDVEDFRQDVLDQRDKISSSSSATGASTATASGSTAGEPVLVEIRDSLVRTEELLRTIVEKQSAN